MGYYKIVPGYYSNTNYVIQGSTSHTVSGSYNNIIGYGNTISYGSYSVLENSNNTVSNSDCHCEGSGCTATSLYCYVTGLNNHANESGAFICGSDNSSIINFATGQNNKGDVVFGRMNKGNTSSNGTHFVEGYNNNVGNTGGQTNLHIEGHSNCISASTYASMCHVEGCLNKINAGGIGTFVCGGGNVFEATNDYYSGYCLLGGSGCTMNNVYYATCLGYGLKTHINGIVPEQGSFVCGKFNDALGAANSVTDLFLFTIGWGSSDTARNNIFVVSKNNNVGCDGSLSTGGADYAEMFEWGDGNPNNEDRVARFVKLIDGDKIEIANCGDNAIGVISGQASVIGDAWGDEWKGKYVTDDFNRIQYEEIVKEDGSKELVPILSKEYNVDEIYIERKDRPEWDAVGLLGKLIVRDDGSCQVGGKCTVGNGGIATAGNDYRVIKRIDNDTIIIFAKMI